MSFVSTGFRHEMSGLARDIRSIRSPRPWRRIAAVAAGILLVLVVALAGFLNTRLFSETSSSAKANESWKANPGEWVVYAVGVVPHYFSPPSVKKLGDKVVFTARLPIKSTKATGAPGKVPSQAAYEDDKTVLDCKQSIFGMSETTTYDKSGAVISHLKWGDPETLVLAGGLIEPDTILAAAEHIMCDARLRTPLLSKDQLVKMNFSHLSRNLTGDGDVFYGAKNPISNSDYQFELLIIVKFDNDHTLAENFPGSNLDDVPPLSYRNLVEPLQLNCTDRKVLVPKGEHYDAENNLVYLRAPITPQPIEIKDTASPYALALNLVCGPSAS
jgi:hypothetical protein